MNKSLWEKYRDGDIPHIHIFSDVIQNAFEDGLCIQADRILLNLQKSFPDKSRSEIIGLMFHDEES